MASVILTLSDPAKLQAWVTMLQLGVTLGTDIYHGIKALAAGALSPADLALLEAAWDEDVQRAAKNAGRPPS